MPSMSTGMSTASTAMAVPLQEARVHPGLPHGGEQTGATATGQPRPVDPPLGTRCRSPPGGYAERTPEIGRASCRERGQSAGEGGEINKKGQDSQHTSNKRLMTRRI